MNEWAKSRLVERNVRDYSVGGLAGGVFFVIGSKDCTERDRSQMAKAIGVEVTLSKSDTERDRNQTAKGIGVEIALSKSGMERDRRGCSRCQSLRSMGYSNPLPAFPR